MNAQELSDLTHLAISNITSKRLDEIYTSMDYKSKSELVNAIRNYVVESHTKDEVQTKSERLCAAIMAVVYQFEQAEVMK